MFKYAEQTIKRIDLILSKVNKIENLYKKQNKLKEEINDINIKYLNAIFLKKA